MAKDVHGMEDIDEFFSEAGWSNPGLEGTDKTCNSYAVPMSQAEEITSSSFDEDAWTMRAEVASRRLTSKSTNILGRDGPTADFSSPDIPVDNQIPSTYKARKLTGSNFFSDKSAQSATNSGHPSEPLSSRLSLTGKILQPGNTKRYTPGHVENMVTETPYREAESEDKVAAKHFLRVDFPSGEANLGVQRHKRIINEAHHSGVIEKNELYVSQSLLSPSPEGLRRSKRTKIAPLAFWRNERIIYTRAGENRSDVDNTLARDVEKFPLQEIVEVIHVPEKVEQVIKGKKKRKLKYKKGKVFHKEGHKPKDGNIDYVSDPEIEGSEWFQNKSLEAEVFENENTRTKRVIAWTPDGGNFKLPPVLKGGYRVPENFKIALLFDTLNGFASGLIEFPRDGFKSLRRSGESLFMFYVARGLIEITLGSEKFIVTRGCSFEILKHNIYSMKNLGHGIARIFFVECRMSKA